MAVAVFVTGVAVSGYALAGPARVRADSSSAAVAEQAREAEQIERALAATRSPLPAGMPTGRPRAIGKPFDALAPDEIGHARWLAARHQRNPGRRVDGSAGYEFLSAALSAEPGRKVAVTSYDYASNVQVLQVVDLASGAVTERSARGVQAPPSETEQLHALKLLITAKAGARLREAYHKSTGRALTSPAQLEVSAGALLNPPPSGDGAACAVDRCVTFQGRVPDGDWLYFGNLAVDLTARTVRTLS